MESICYNPGVCRYISNCSGYYNCDESEHHVSLLDQTFYSNVLREYCFKLTCCLKILCSYSFRSSATANVPLPIPPPPLSASSENDHMTYGKTILINSLFIVSFILTTSSCIIICNVIKRRQHIRSVIEDRDRDRDQAQEESS
jgi:hypothetical protein